MTTPCLSSGISDPSHRLVQSLQSPSAYNHPVDNIRLLETHISWVILTGRYAYKLKKPVNLGFLDFSTLERRRFYCLEEIRLNRRLAPEIYIGVVPITGTPEAPSMAGTGNPIEFAVQMCEFPQEALLSHVLQRRELMPHHIDALAREIAGFHSRIEIASPNSPFGNPEVVRQTTEESLAHLMPGDQSNALVEHIKSWCQTEFEARRDEFLRRKQRGFVRECHGDMHLGNMLLLDGRPVLFDCIEFNERFRWIDVLSEVAFTVMDLEDRGNRAAARRFLSEYLEETGDYSGLSVFRYYLVYRALVRAKVTSIRLDQEDILPDERKALLTEYDGYVELAERYTRPPQPILAITHGPSGSGKSTVAEAVVEELGAIRVRSDVERKRLLGLKPLERTAHKAADVYSAAATDRTYARLAELACAAVRAGYSAVADATFLKRSQRQQFQRLATQLDVPFAILDLQASETDLRQRVTERAMAGSDASDADLAVLAQQLATRELLDEEEQACTIPVSSDQPRAAATAMLAHCSRCP
ncbi:MAG: AAA family ATPase [Planctomycetes bacterium]|nr:AAA family ATPase [Planctomycetota bacterium]